MEFSFVSVFFFYLYLRKFFVFMQIKKFLISIFLIACFAACEEGKDGLEGKWQLRKMQYDDKVVQVDTVYYNFQFGVFKLQAVNHIPSVLNETVGSYNIVEDTIKMNIEPSFASNLTALKRYYDWDGPSENFRIVKQSASSLHLLRKDDVLFIFRKF